MATVNSNTSLDYKLILTVTQKSQSIANNTSVLSWNLKMSCQSYRYENDSTTDNFKVVINGTTVYNQNKVIKFTSKNMTLSIASGTTPVTHASDGTKSVALSCSFTPGRTASYYPSALIGSGSMTLTTIPRASSFGTVSGNTIGSSMTINISRNSSSFTHSLWYSFGGVTWQGIGSGVGTSVSFTPPLSLCSQVPSATSGTMTLILRTFNGSTQVGSDVYKSITVYVPTSVVPSVSTISLSEATGNLASVFGVYIKTKSTLKTTISASGSYGSTIKTYKTTIDGTTYSGSSFTSYALKNSGTLTISTTVTDSRGRTASKSTTVTVHDYFAPKITRFDVQRCNSDGTLNDEGTCAKFTYSFSIAPINNKNSKTVGLEYYDSVMDAMKTCYSDNSTYSATNATYVDSGYGTDTSYKVGITVYDYFGYTTVEKELPTAFTLINYGEDGKSIAFGKVDEGYPFDVGLLALFRKGIRCNPTSNPILSTGTDTVDTWNELGNSVHYYNTAGCLIDQPNQYGILLNSTNNQKNVHQLWLSQPNGVIYHRGGNANGWSGTWKPLLDSQGGSIAGGSNKSTASGINWALTLRNTDWSESTGYGMGLKLTNSSDNTGKYAGIACIAYSGYSNETGLVFYVSKDSTTPVDAYRMRWDRFIPTGNNVRYLGDSSNRWISVYAVNGTIQTSDQNKKENIEVINNKYEELFNLLNPVSFNFSDPKSDRTHLGYISQDVEDAMSKVGLTALDFGGFCKDKKQKENEITGKLEDVLDENGNPIYEYSLRYSEFIALNTHMIQKQQKEIKDLKDEVAQLKELVNQLVKGAQ